tara:strand:+ start:448 stop:1005 length:558 start_codon:yes stop_codon:yes gene_type:complete
MEDTKPAKHAGGRPTKLTDELKNIIVQSVTIGVPLDTAASLAGISQSTLRLWAARGRHELDRVNGNGRRRILQIEEIYVEFSEALRKAIGLAVLQRVKNIQDAEAWQSDAWWLERRYPEEFGRREALEVTGANKGPVEVEVTSISQVVKRAREAHQARISKVERVEGDAPALEEGVKGVKRKGSK